MKTRLLVLIGTFCCFLAAQDSSDLFDKAPPPVDEALRARVAKFYEAHTEGKFREAFTLVAEDSQDAFFAAAKQQYKGCETIRINYSEEFTKAAVIEACEVDLRFHGQVFHSKAPITTNWKVENGQWYWYYVKPKVIPSPFGPIVAPDSTDAKETERSIIPDPAQAARSILALVKVDKTTIRLSNDQAFKDELHVRNQMQGAVSLNIGPLPLARLTVTPGKTELQPNEESAVVFEYHPNLGESMPPPVMVQLHIRPTGQTFPVRVTFSSTEKPDGSKQ